ncbi:MAG: glutamate racemase [Clostridiaceae bacterium]
MEKRNRPIGFFDSGVGGLSVLKETLKLLPNEDYIYFGDSINAPYGTKNVEEVKKYAFNAVKLLLDKDAKAIVVACNTATSVAIKELREKYNNIPIIGIEPAIKPAVEMKKNGKILIMATPMTLSMDKFNNLVENYNDKEIIPLPCPGLAEIIEQGIVSGDKIKFYLQDKFKNIKVTEISTIVLGCTHYPFIKKEIRNLLGNDIDIIDGSLGTSKRLKYKLEENNILSGKEDKGSVVLYNSKEDNMVLELCYKLLNS